jgi:endogenous inhibitor of DNA gyrase (YacG/DUF329 family)
MSALPPCPVCKRKSAADDGDSAFPFCSQRCKLLDMGNWLDGRYVVASPLPFDETFESGAAEPPDGEPS